MRMEECVTNLSIFTVPYSTDYKANLASKSDEQKI